MVDGLTAEKRQLKMGTRKMKLYRKLILAIGSSGALIGAIGSASADQVIVDDQIVQGSSCVGTDCVNGESFGFDTIRIKENNVRIHFDDTSNSASFPQNDWRLIANDSGNGGANYLAIEDSNSGRIPFRVEAGAAANALVVEADSDIGIGTLNPVVELHVVDGDSPTLRLEQDGSSGFTPQTWDMAGNETNFFIRDVTNGSQLPFRIKPGSGTGDAIVIDADGDVGFGTDSPDAALHVRGAGDTALLIQGNSRNLGEHAELHLKTPDYQWELRSNTVNGTFAIRNASSTFELTPVVVSPLAATNLLRVGFSSTGAQDANNINITGSLTASGTITPDYVFQSSYDLLSMEDHAEFMWKNSHLPHVEKAKVDANGAPYFDMVSRSQDLLEELEVAHIYIQQLNEKIKQLKVDKQDALSLLENRIERLESSQR